MDLCSFPRLDYSGIALLIMGSFVPWLYYSFYCNPQPCFIYLIVICVLGIAAIVVSQWDMFATPQYRGVRAGKSMWSFDIGHLVLYQAFTKGPHLPNAMLYTCDAKKNQSRFLFLRCL